MVRALDLPLKDAIAILRFLRDPRDANGEPLPGGACPWGRAMDRAIRLPASESGAILRFLRDPRDAAGRPIPGGACPGE